MKKILFLILCSIIIVSIPFGNVLAQSQADCDNKCDDDFVKCLEDNASKTNADAICEGILNACYDKCESDDSASGLENGADCPSNPTCKSNLCEKGKCVPQPDPNKPDSTNSDPNSNPSAPTKGEDVPVVLPEADGVSFFGLFEAETVPELIVQLYKYAISIVGIMIFIQFIRAGFVYLTAAGNAGKTGQATQYMTNAVIGAVLLFSAYLILNVINPDLLTLKLDLSQPPGGAATTGTTGSSDTNTGDTGGPAAIGSFGMTGTCKGNACGETKANICGDTQVSCGGIEKWDAQIKQGVQSGGKICGNINVDAFVRALMSQESSGNISAASDAGAYGLMQILPETGNQAGIKGPCGVTETVDRAWLTTEANAAKSVCIAIQILKSNVGACTCDIRQLAAGYNGGGAGLGACGISQDCNGAGQCTVCQGSTTVRRWECPWEDADHKTCNNALKGNFSATRQYVPKVSYCYKKLGGG